MPKKIKKKSKNQEVENLRGEPTLKDISEILQKAAEELPKKKKEKVELVHRKRRITRTTERSSQLCIRPRQKTWN
jgi:DNA topoisomerase VI subunit A